MIGPGNGTVSNPNATLYNITPIAQTSTPSVETPTDNYIFKLKF